MLCLKCAERDDLEDWEKGEMEEGTDELAKDIGVEINIDLYWYWCRQCGNIRVFKEPPNGETEKPTNLVEISDKLVDGSHQTSFKDGQKVYCTHCGVIVPKEKIYCQGCRQMNEDQPETPPYPEVYVPVHCSECNMLVGYVYPEDTNVNANAFFCPFCAHKEDNKYRGGRERLQEALNEKEEKEG